MDTQTGEMREQKPKTGVTVLGYDWCPDEPSGEIPEQVYVYWVARSILNGALDGNLKGHDE